MNRFRPTLPWLLLTLSLTANAGLLFRLRPPAGPSTDFVTNLVTNSRPPQAGDVTRLVTSPLPPTSADSNSSPSAPQSAPSASATPPASPVATFSAYADLLAQSLETPGQHDDLARVLARWIASDPASASDWLNRQPDDPRFDLPVSQVANHLVATGDYRLAREWAESIRTPEVRVAAIEEVLAEQYRHRQLTPDALTAAAGRAGLSPERVQGILNYSRLD